MLPMAANEQPPLHLTHEDLARLLLTGDCPVRYNCLAMDCLECLEIYIDRGGENNGE